MPPPYLIRRGFLSKPFSTYKPIKMILKKLRIILAFIFFTCITIFLCRPTDVAWMNWIVKLQFLPALLSLNAIAIIITVLITLLFGRIYCSVICPFGVLQDIIIWINGIINKRMKIHKRYEFSKEKRWLRYSVLLFYVVGVLLGVSAIITILEPYASYGRIVSAILHPTLPTTIVAAATFLIIAFLAVRYGRTYCNTICPVGTTLGILSRFSLLKPVIDTTKCTGCKVCSNKCKASCINPQQHSIDYSRCLACMDCLTNCNQGAITYRIRTRATQVPTAPQTNSEPSEPNRSTIQNPQRRQFLTVAGIMTASYALAQKHKVDGGLAEIISKEEPTRKNPILPPGAISQTHLSTHCTGCQLCVSACPNKVLHPSGSLTSFLQPHSSYELGFCRPECTKCSEICPTGAIKPIVREAKPDIHIGHAVVHRHHCEKLPSGDSCGNCARHCPVGAITMVKDKEGHLFPVVDKTKCTGCGACEYLCPVRPFSAIHVEGYENHIVQ